MNTKCKFWIIISVTVILLLAFCGCEGLGAAVPQSEALTETAPSKETTPLTDNQINSQKTGTGSRICGDSGGDGIHHPAQPGNSECAYSHECIQGGRGSSRSVRCDS